MIWNTLTPLNVIFLGSSSGVLETDRFRFLVIFTQRLTFLEEKGLHRGPTVVCVCAVTGYLSMTGMNNVISKVVNNFEFG